MKRYETIIVEDMANYLVVLKEIRDYMKRYETITVEDMANYFVGADCDQCPVRNKCGLMDEEFDCCRYEDWLNYLNEEVSDEIHTIRNISQLKTEIRETLDHLRDILEDEKWHDVRR